MRELIEFRIPEEHASRWLSSHHGESLGGTVRKLELSADDSLMSIVGEADRELKLQGRAFFTAWKRRRAYTKAELEEAPVFRLEVAAVFEPAGESCGTKYDESTGCQSCGAGAVQSGPLFLDLKRIPKGKDFAKTIAGEIVVSRRARDVLAEHSATGAAFHPVRAREAKGLEPCDWSQLVIRSTDVDIVAPTRAGVDPFDDDSKGEYRCPMGDLIGLNLLSELTVGSTTLGRLDVVASKRFFGVRRGLLRPERALLISPKVRNLIESERLKGCEIEVAHVV